MELINDPLHTSDCMKVKNIMRREGWVMANNTHSKSAVSETSVTNGGKQAIFGFLFVTGLLLATLCNMTSGCFYGVISFGIGGLISLVFFLGTLSLDE